MIIIWGWYSVEFSLFFGHETGVELVKSVTLPSVMYELREVWNAAFWNKVGMLQNVKVGSIPIEKNNMPSNGLYTSEAWLLTIPKVPLAGKLETDQHNPCLQFV